MSKAAQKLLSIFKIKQLVNKKNEFFLKLYSFCCSEITKKFTVETRNNF